jgi:uncharacterized membrane protein
MWQTDSTIEIAVPADTVYDYLADFTRHPEWSTGVVDLVPVGNGPLAVGTEFTATEEVPAHFTSQTRITALEPGRRIAWQSWDGRTMKVDWAFELAPESGKTRLVQRARIQPTSLIGRILLTAMRKRQIPKENAQSLAQIKSRLENRPAHQVAT